MRSGGCAVVQQELAGDAAAVMRQAVILARRRGHAQVTPLHAASAMLTEGSGGGGLLRAACLRSRAGSHPLQCKALELCFNVALSRLATAAGASAMFPSFHAHHHRAPALSNALAAAFKRAQANQRRGGVGVGVSSAEGQQQYQAAASARVELDQLVISILDDPGVSRVMREAGFSSAEVKANVEKAVSSSSPEQSSNTAASSTASCCCASPNKPSSFRAAADAARVLDCMASGERRCVAVVGEGAEAVVKAVMDTVSKGGVPRHAQFVPFSAASFRGSPREEVEARAADLRAIAREARAAEKGVVLVLEDLAYAAEAWRRAAAARGGYCPVEHAVLELGGLVRGGHDDTPCLLAFGSYASYASCRSGQPSLEAVLDLHPVAVPDERSLALGLGGGDSEITHCGADMVVATAASVPSWIRRCQHQSPPVLTGSGLTLSFSSPASSSLGGYTHYYDANTSCEPWHDDPIHRRRQPLLNREHDGPIMATDSCDQQLLANPNPPRSSISVSKSNSLDDGATAAKPAARHRRPKFTELTAENLKILCAALEARVPRHGDVAPAIASAVLRRRSGVTRTARPSSATWLLFRGRDSDGKTAMARELARLVFGSYADFTCIAAASTELTLAPSGSNSGDGLKRKRSPDNAHGGCMQRFYEAIRENPHRVVMIGGGAEHDSVAAGIKDAMAAGTVRGCDSGVVSLEDAIVVSCDEGFESRSRVSSPRPPVKQQRVMMGDVGGGKVEDDGAEKGAVPLFGLDLNACAAMDGEEWSSFPNDTEILKAVDGVFFFQY